MLMHDDRKKITSVILSKMGNDGKTTDRQVSGDSMDGRNADLENIAQDLIDGTKSGSARLVASALKAFWDCIQAADEEQDRDFK